VSRHDSSTLDCLEIISAPKKVLIFEGRLAYDRCGIFVNPDPQGKKCPALNAAP